MSEKTKQGPDLPNYADCGIVSSDSLSSRDSDCVSGDGESNWNQGAMAPSSVGDLTSPPAALFVFGGQFFGGGGGSTKKLDVNVKAPAVPGKSP
jgi:hypothetical protein